MTVDLDICYPKSEANPNGDALPKQNLFHISQKKFRIMEGGWGTGKTLAICLELSKDIAIDNNYILMGRKDLQEFKSTTLKEFLDIYEPAIASHNKQDRVIKFSNGTEIYYTNLDDSRDALNKIASLNLGCAVIDQCEEISQIMFETIKGRLRRQKARRCFYGAANPNGHDWIWEDFIELPFYDYAKSIGYDRKKADIIVRQLDDTHYLKLENRYKEIAVIEGKESKQIQMLHNKSHYEGWVSTSLENPFLPNDTLQSYLNLPEKVKKRYVFCSFDDFTGNVYSDYREDVNKLSSIYIPQEYEKKYIVLDYGYRNPTAVGFWIVDYDGRATMYDEIYESEKKISEITDIIKEREGWKTAYKLADPSIWNVQQNGRCIADDYRDYGLTFLPADNDVSQGIDRVNQLLKDGYLLISANCVNWFYERDRYKWRDLKPGQDRNEYEEPLKKDDHLMDMTRYFVNYIYKPYEKTEQEKLEEERRKLSRHEVLELEEEIKDYTF